MHHAVCSVLWAALVRLPPCSRDVVPDACLHASKRRFRGARFRTGARSRARRTAHCRRTISRIPACCGSSAENASGRAPPSEAAKSCAGLPRRRIIQHERRRDALPARRPGCGPARRRGRTCEHLSQPPSAVPSPSLPNPKSLLALAAYVTVQSRGMPMDVPIDTQNRRDFELGREPVLSAARADESFVRAVSRPQLGTHALARDDQPGARHRLPGLSPGVAERGIAPAAHPRLLFGPARRDAALRCAASCSSSSSSSRGGRTGWRSKRRAYAAS